MEPGEPEDEPELEEAPDRPRREYFAGMSMPKGPKKVDKSKRKSKAKQAAKSRKKARKKNRR